MSFPGPSSSDFLNSPEISAQPSRKRQRSQSMQSDSGTSNSSAIRRTVADNNSGNEIQIRNGREKLFHSTQPDDAYMDENLEPDIPFMPASQPSPALSREEKLAFVENGKKVPMEVGDTWYLVARDWYKRWWRALTGEVDKEGPITEQDLGPVDNSSLLDTYRNLLPSLAEGVDVEYVPRVIWDILVQWYGPAIDPLPRRVIARGATKLPALELIPLRLKVFKLVKSLSSTNSPHPWVTISAGETIAELCTKLAHAVSPDKDTGSPYRVWNLTTDVDDKTETEFLGSQLPDAKIIEESDKTLEEHGIESDDTFVVEFKQPDGWIADAPKADQTRVAAFENFRPLFNSNDGFFNRMSPLSSQRPANSYGGIGLYDRLTSSTSRSPSTAVTVGNKSLMKTLEPGTLGLGNMGNTCFMNSALQCLAHTKELTDYFLSGVYDDEVNRDNPLGMGGAIAEAFGALLQRIWAATGSSTSYSPREFKSQLQRFAPQFSGYQQHDSQELVAFLLDGLHEDLNRVIKKPYVEKPDWEGGGDLELVELAQKSWEGYMMRNDSVIVDLFQGQYQSTLVCPECQKVSITFDPFMYLTLPLPIQKKWQHFVFYVPWDLEKPHVKVPVEINRDASFKDLRQLLGRWMGAIPENLLTMEIFSHRFYKNLEDSHPVGDMSDTDIIVCFELPCNARQSRTYKKQPDDPLLVPVYLCDAKPSKMGYYYTSARASTPALFGYPMVIAIDRETAKDVEAMYELITTRLQRWTSQARDLYTWEVGSPIDEVPILINGFPPIESITEITEDGNVVTVHSTPSPLEGDIVDEKRMSIDDDQDVLDGRADGLPRKVGAKKDIFNLRLQVNHKDFGTAYNAYTSSNRWEAWEDRIRDTDPDTILLRDDDAFFCEFDEDKRAYYFGDNQRHEHALWDKWESFIHPEYEESKKANAEKRNNGISLQDCLDEFTREEQLGEDDLWYCPQCKKHQQASKKFDLWKAPDILVVHLKRFSNNRSLRDKIDTHIDFPIEGLDLGHMVGERKIAKTLLDQGVDIEGLKLGNLDEPLVYDLFGVDEHIGGLGGGHYRAYASNHLNGNWYHFDDSYVTPARASDSVNAHAYLLFYRRRTRSALGGKSFLKIQEAKLQPQAELKGDSDVTIDTQLPTPPNEKAEYTSIRPYFSILSSLSSDLAGRPGDSWNMRSGGSNAGSSVPSPPNTDDPPEFDEYLPEIFGNYNDRINMPQRFDFPDPSGKASPTSSNEAAADIDTDLDRDAKWASVIATNFTIRSNETHFDRSRRRSPDTGWEDAVSHEASPSYSELSDSDPFSDANVQQTFTDDEPMETSTHVHEKTA